MINEHDLEAWDYYSQNPPKEAKESDWVKRFMEVTGQTPDPELYAKLIGEEIHEWWLAWAAYPDDKENRQEELKELTDLLFVIHGYALSMGWNLEEAFRRVAMNNIGRCVWPDGSVKRREDGKIMKNPNHPKVDLGDLV